MGRIHSIFLVLSALAFFVLLFDSRPSSDGIVPFVRTGVILVAPIILLSFFLHGKLQKQVNFLKIVRAIVVLLLILYYYLLWSADAFSGWFNAEGEYIGLFISQFTPMFGYVFLSLSVRVLTRNLRLLGKAERLRS